MNFYIVVEGEKSEILIYKKWIKYIRPNQKCVYNLSEITNNNFIIYAGYGYPFYLDVIDAAIEDVNSHNSIDRLVIAVDSEEMTYSEKFNEINDFVKNKKCKIEIYLIIQHFCIETWALGNKVIIPRRPQNVRLRKYINFFNVISEDPELMPVYPDEKINRSQFALKYLKTAINERYRNLTYSKNNPKVLLNRNYFKRIKNRLKDTGHIASFQNFLNAFN